MSEEQRESTTTDAVLRCALLGCGTFASAYHLPAVLADDRVELVVVCDPAPAPAVAEAARRRGAVVTADTERAFADDCDFVIISTPHSLHAGHVAVALNAGKHVLVDKPFVLSSSDAEELASIAKRSGLVAGVAFNRRLDSAYIHAKSSLERGELGEPQHVETIQLGYPAGGWWANLALSGGGPFVGRTAHLADAVPWLVGRQPLKVSAALADDVEGYADAGGWISVELSGGLAWRCTTLVRGYPMWDELRIFGDAGMVEIRRPPDSLIEWVSTYRSAQDGRERIGPRGIVKPAAVDFVDAILDRREPACSFVDAWRSVRIVEAAYESTEDDGRWIDIDTT